MKRDAQRQYLGTEDDPFWVKQGEPIIALVAVVTGADRPANITGYELDSCQLRRSLAVDQNAPLLEGAVTILELTMGESQRGFLQIVFGADLTRFPQIPPGLYVFDAVMSNPASDEDGLVTPTMWVEVDGTVSR